VLLFFVEVYEGNWSRGQMHGTGVFTGADGKQYKGIWELGKRKI
jgi:hypothetical protein